MKILFWSTREGINLISFCHKQIEENGLELCITTCMEFNNKTLIPVFQAVYDNLNQLGDKEW